MNIDLLKMHIVIYSLVFITYQKFFTIVSSPPSPVNPNCTATGPNNNHQIVFGNCFQNVYMIQINIGSNQQPFNFQFDTGSDILWVPIIGGSITQGFNSAQSSSYVPSNLSQTLYYANNAQVQGFYGSDLIYIPGTQINVTSSYILFVTNQSNMNILNGVSGLVGMGYNKTPNFFDLAYGANQISTPVFSLQLNYMNQTSYLYYDNGLPSNIVKNTIWVQINDDQNWQLQVLGVFFGQKQYTSMAAPSAIIDSATSYFYLNQALFNAIQPLLYFDQCQISNNENKTFCPCSIAYDNWPTFSFVFSGVKVYINSSQYIVVYTKNSSLCTYSFGVLKNSQYIILGDVFFRGYTISFDKPNALIGFYGNTTAIYLGGTGTFLASQYVMFGLFLALGIYGLLALYILRSQKRERESNHDSEGYFTL